MPVEVNLIPIFFRLFSALLRGWNLKPWKWVWISGKHQTLVYLYFQHEPVYLSQNEGFIVVYAIDEPRTFQTAKQLIKLIRELKKQRSQQTAIVLVGNKVDLSHTRAVCKQEALEFASEYECFFHETSAANDINVKIIFHDAVRQLRVFQLNKKANGPMNSIKNFFSRWGRE